MRAEAGYAQLRENKQLTEGNPSIFLFYSLISSGYYSVRPCIFACILLTPTVKLSYNSSKTRIYRDFIMFTAVYKRTVPTIANRQKKTNNMVRQMFGPQQELGHDHDPETSVRPKIIHRGAPQISINWT